MYKYQEYGRYFAQIAGGTEELGVAELTELGAREATTAYRGVHFEADRETLYRINYASRLVTRILAPLTSFGCHDPDYLYRTLREVDWGDFLDPDRTFAVYANVSNSRIRHSKYAALRVKDAIVDHFREATGRRPNVDVHEPDVWFNLYVENNHATLSLGTSAGSMHRRGYRTGAGSAPMQETVAAAIIRLTEWEG
ncbi:MAG TPA: THUMP domain-containing protein [Rhodothermales bacterium]